MAAITVLAVDLGSESGRGMINGHDIQLAQGLDMTVSANDEIAIFPPIAGG